MIGCQECALLWASLDTRTRALTKALKAFSNRAAASPLDEYTALRLEVDEKRIDWDLACSLLDAHRKIHASNPKTLMTLSHPPATHPDAG
jgi:hypothetical protein